MNPGAAKKRARPAVLPAQPIIERKRERCKRPNGERIGMG
jgi:hypothetical protein